MGILDTTAGSAYAAYGIYKLRNAYSGPGVRVKRTSDNAETDINFSGIELDWAAANTFGATLKVVTWYDQSGNARHITSSSGNEPLLDTTEKSIRFGQSGSTYFDLPNLSSLSAGEGFFYRKIDNDPSSTGGGGIWKIGSDSASSNHIPFSDGVAYDSFGSTVRKDTAVNPSSPMTAYHVFSAYSVTNDWADYMNGTLIYSTATNTVGFAASPLIGASYNFSSHYMVGHGRAFILFSAKVAGGDRTILGNTSNYAPPPPNITTTSLPGGTTGVAYSQTLGVTGGTGSITWSKPTGSLPTGLSLNSSTGEISGTPTVAGTYNFTVRATDTVSAFDDQSLTIIVSDPPPVPTTEWSLRDPIPRSSLLAWHCSDSIKLNDGDAVSELPDISGNNRTLVVASNKPTFETNIINGLPAIYFNGSRNPLKFTGNLTAKHIFVVAAYEDAAFPSGEPGYAGLLSSGTTLQDPLVGNPSSTKFFDFDWETFGAYGYRRRDVSFPENDQQAAFNNALSIFEVSFTPGWGMDGITLGQQRNIASRLWKGFWCETLMYGRVLDYFERFDVYCYLAMKYRIWRQVSSGLDVWPFQPNWTYPFPADKTVLASRAISGAFKAREKGTAKDRFGLSFQTRSPEETNAAKEFWNSKYPANTFIYRDDAYSPARDTEVRIISPFNRQPNGYRDIDYSIEFEEV